MEITNKNKEEIEKIQKYVEDSLEQGEYNLNSSILEERIKTSILWCEDEIIRIDKLRHRIVFFYTDEMNEITVETPATWEQQEDIKKIYDIFNSELQQLQTHLTWLKEQEKKQ